MFEPGIVYTNEAKLVDDEPDEVVEDADEEPEDDDEEEDVEFTWLITAGC